MGNTNNDEQTKQESKSIKNQLMGLISKATDTDSIIDQAQSLCPKLTFKQRMIGFGVCSVTGWVLSIFSMISFLSMLSGDPTTFAIVFAISQILTVAGICFIAGPKSQVKDLKKPGRLLATLIFIASIVMTLVSALAIKIKALIVVFVVVQLCAYVWYCVSLFPFGQKLCKGCLKNLCF